MGLLAKMARISALNRPAEGAGLPGRRLAPAALIVSVAFVASRLLGVVRNIVIADVFGNSRQIEAYFAAFRIPDALFTLVSGGVLASAFVPVFAGLLQLGDEEEAWEVANTVFTALCIALIGLGVIAFVFAGQIMDVLVQGYTPQERSLTIELTRIMLLQPIFLGAAALITAILQTYHRFAITGAAPLLYTLPVILGAIFFGSSHGVAVLAWAVVIGAAAQLAIQLPALREHATLHLRLSWASAGAREVMRLIGPRILGLAAFQAMLFITLYLAAGLPVGMVGAINYSWPLIWFPVTALGTAAATAIFPTLSRMGAAENVDALKVTVNRSLRLVVFLALPAAAGLGVLRRPVIGLLYAHGRWTNHATEQTALALLFFALAVPALASIEVMPRVFYALKDTITPVRIAVVAVAVDAVLSVVLVHLLAPSVGQGGLALATAIASTLQALWLIVVLDERLGGVGRRALLFMLRDAAIATAVMALALYVTLYPLQHSVGLRGWGALITLCVEVPLGAAAYAAGAWLLGAPELERVRSIIPGLK
jgi:putative peptidoglycan lipid II flippase